MSNIRFLFLAVFSTVLCRAVAADSENQVAQAGFVFRDCANCPEMVVVPAGTFLMGSSAEETARDLEAAASYNKPVAVRPYLAFEHPQHAVNLDRPFALGKNLVTKGEYAAFVRETGYSTAGGCTLWSHHEYLKQSEAGWQNPGFAQADLDPVVCVSWQDAKAYLAWLNSKLTDGAAAKDGPYRLPSEAEWEYAARGGTRTARWWGDSIGSGNANCGDCGSLWDERRTSPVGSFRANAFGLSDVMGNAWEWTEDCWHTSYAGALDDSNAWTDGNCESRVIRGGSWTNDPWVLRCGTC